MAEKGKESAGGKGLKRRGKYCKAGFPNNRSCKNNTFIPGIAMHTFPREEMIRAKWIKFVQRHRPEFQAPSSKARNTTLCSAHFTEDYFTMPRGTIAGMENCKFIRKLVKGAIPTVDAAIVKINHCL